MHSMNRYLLGLLAAIVLAGCGTDTPEVEPAAVEAPSNPFLAGLNEPIAYGDVTAEHVTEYGDIILERSQQQLEAIKAVSEPTLVSPGASSSNRPNTSSTMRSRI